MKKKMKEEKGKKGIYLVRIYAFLPSLDDKWLISIAFLCFLAFVKDDRKSRLRKVHM